MPAINTDILARQLPDTAGLICARGMLLAGEGEVYGLSDSRPGFIVMNPRQQLAAVVGNPAPAAFDAMQREAPPSVQLIVPPSSQRHAESALDGWTWAEAALHLRRGSWIVPDANDPAPRSDPALVHRTELLARDEALNDRTIPDALRAALQQAQPGSPAAIAFADDGSVVSLCSTMAITETLWDVSIDTVETHRRQGFASACVAALARYMEGLGKRAVWGAEDGNIESASLAQKLSFTRVDRVFVFRRPLTEDE